jgi:hypothetical protein
VAAAKTNMGIDVQGIIRYNAPEDGVILDYGDNIPELLKPYCVNLRESYSAELTGTEIDFNFWNSLYQTVSADTIYTMANIVDGKEISLLLTNSDASDHVITITGVVFGNGADSFTLPASSSTHIKLVSINSVVVGWVNIVSAAVDPSFASKITAVDDDYTVLVDDDVLLITATDDLTVTLPTTSEFTKKVIRCSYSNGSGKTIQFTYGSILFSTTAASGWFTCVFDGTDWWKLSQA